MSNDKQFLIAFSPLIFFILARVTKLTTHYDWPFYVTVIIGIIAAIIVPNRLKVIPVVQVVSLIAGLVTLGGFR